jgi:hypothetical protein
LREWFKNWFFFKRSRLKVLSKREIEGLYESWSSDLQQEMFLSTLGLDNGTEDEDRIKIEEEDEDVARAAGTLVQMMGKRKRSTLDETE